MPAEDLRAVVNQNANVRTGPSTDHSVAFWLTAGDEVTVVGRNEEGSWLRIEHEDRPGWIFAALTDIAAEGVAELRADAPPVPAAAEPVPEPTVAVEPDPTPQPAPEPTPEPTREPQTETSDRATATVTGSVVNLRRGPGTDHPTAGQVRAGDQLHVTARNADGSWLQVMHPVATGELVWVYGPLTDLDSAMVATLAMAGPVEVVVEIETSPTPEPAAAAVRAPQPPTGCTRLHTVNPNETQLSQITDWFGLDLAATAALNGLATDTPLTAGRQICLPDAATVQPQPAPQSQPAPASQPVAGGPCQTPIGPQPYLHIPDFSERGFSNAAVGEIVVATGLDILWHAPGTYERDLPGLDYDFEVRFTDISVQRDWRIRDFEGCYDALRVHMGVVPEEFNLRWIEFRLADSFISVEPDGYRASNWREFHWRENSTYFSPQDNPGAIPLGPPSEWDQAAVPHPDLALAKYGCYRQPDGQALCDIIPAWGNSHSIHLNATVTRAMANTVMYRSSNALANQYRSRLHERVLQADAYLFPMIDNNRGEPAGQGPCADLWRAR